MSKELAQAVGGKRIALLVAILATFALFATLGNQLGTKSAGAVEIDPLPTPTSVKINLACSPVTSSQQVVGSTQSCTVRVINTGSVNAENVTIHHNGIWNPTSIIGWYAGPCYNSSGNVIPSSSCNTTAGIDCTVAISSCSLPVIAPGRRGYIKVDYVVTPHPDGIGKTTATVVGDNVAEKTSGYETASLP